MRRAGEVLKGLYAITPEAPGSEGLFAQVEQALAGGISALQYRAKAADRPRREREARALLVLCRAHGVPLIVNDDLELALAVDADGVHLGREDGELRAARARLGDKLLGASCYDRFDLAERAAAAGADYVAFGSLFPSATKPDAVRAPLELLRRARALGKTVVAIGGITIGNAAQVFAAGAHSVAVISDLFEAPNIAARARAYRALFHTTLNKAMP